MFKVSILTIGSEILDGRILNSNAQYFGRILNINNIGVHEVLSCDDDIEHICDALDYLFKSTKYVITSGGLGPTSDDLTRDAVAKFTKKPLYENSELLSGIKDWYKSKNRQFIDLNAVQALIPEDSTPIYNANGTAPGYIVEFERGKIASLPGIPRELFPMFEEQVLPDIHLMNPDKIISYSSTLRTFGIAESGVATKINALRLPKDTRVIYQVQFPEVKIVLINENHKDNIEVRESIVNEIGQDLVISNDDKNLSQVIHELLISKEISLSIAESCSGGYLSNTITTNSGASIYFKGSVICYDNQVKINQLGVSSQTIESYGVISTQVVSELLDGLSEKFKTDSCIAIVGVAGPESLEEKPVGTVYIGVKLYEQVLIKEYFWNYSREQIKQFATSQSLDLLRRMILGLSI